MAPPSDGVDAFPALRAAALLLALGAGAAEAHAGGWDWAHPRRAEVGARLDDQQHRIVDGLRDGELSGAQAHRIHEEDAAIRLEERTEAAVGGGRIGRGEQRALDAQEDAVSRQIRFERAY